MSMGLFFALENEDVAAAAGEFDPTAVPMAEVEKEVGTIVTEAEEINQVIQASEETSDSANTLQQVQGVAQAAVDSGQGLSEDAAQVAQVVVESICNKLGIRNSYRLMPATESFGSSNTRLSATKIAVEGIGDVIKKIWEGIKRVVKSLWEKIKLFFARFFANVDKVRKANDALLAKVRTYAGKSIETNTFQNSGLFKMFGHSRSGENKAGAAKKFEPELILKNHTGLTGATGGFVKALQDAATAAVTAVEGLKTAISVKGSAAKTADSTVTDKVTVAMKGISAAMDTYAKASSVGQDTVKIKGGEGADSSSEAHRVGPFYQGKTINWITTVSKGKAAADGAAAIPEYKVKNFTFGSLKVSESDDNTEIKTLTLPEMEKFIGMNDDLLKATNEFKRNQSEFDSLVKAVGKTAEGALEVAKVTTEEISPAYRSLMQSLAGQIQSAVNAAGTMSVNLPLGNVMVVKGIMAYCEQSLKQYSKA